MLWVTAMAGASLVRVAALAALDPCCAAGLLHLPACQPANLAFVSSRAAQHGLVAHCPLAIPLSGCTEEERNSCCHDTPEATPEYFNAGFCVLTPRYVFYCEGDSCWTAVRGGCEKKTHPTLPASLTSHEACVCPLPLCPSARMPHCPTLAALLPR
jgi:hypothetical protein